MWVFCDVMELLLPTSIIVRSDNKAGGLIIQGPLYHMQHDLIDHCTVSIFLWGLKPPSGINLGFLFWGKSDRFLFLGGGSG